MWGECRQVWAIARESASAHGSDWTIIPEKGRSVSDAQLPPRPERLHVQLAFIQFATTLVFEDGLLWMYRSSQDCPCYPISGGAAS